MYAPLKCIESVGPGKAKQEVGQAATYILLTEQSRFLNEIVENWLV
jgi:hypothetical protein